MPNIIPESKYIKATIGDYEYQIHKQVREGGQVILAIIGKDGAECAHMKFNYNDPEKELVLSGLSYKKKCRIGAEMERGIQTVYMIKSLLIYALQEYPEFDYVGLMDMSSRECMEGGEQLDLAEYNYWLYGKTWYQRNFGAIPDPTDHGLLHGLHNLDACLNSPITEDISRLFFRTGDNFPASFMKQEFNTLYEIQKREGKTWRQFLYAVFSRESSFVRKYGFPTMCGFFIYVHKILLNVLHIGFQLAGTMWNIPRGAVEKYHEFDTIQFNELSEPIHARGPVRGGAKTLRPRRKNDGYGGSWRQLSFGRHPSIKQEKSYLRKKTLKNHKIRLNS